MLAASKFFGAMKLGSEPFLTICENSHPPPIRRFSLGESGAAENGIDELQLVDPIVRAPGYGLFPLCQDSCYRDRRQERYFVNPSMAFTIS